MNRKDKAIAAAVKFQNFMALIKMAKRYGKYYAS